MNTQSHAITFSDKELFRMHILETLSDENCTEQEACDIADIMVFQVEWADIVDGFIVVSTWVTTDDMRALLNDVRSN